jgi:hypothetical protein
MQPALNPSNKPKLKKKHALTLMVLFGLGVVLLNLALSSRGTTQANIEAAASPETCACPTPAPCGTPSCVPVNINCFTCAQVQSKCPMSYLAELAQRCGCSYGEGDASPD